MANERIPTDTDAGPESVVGVGVAETITRTLHETQPNWLQDGHGVRGPQEVRERPAPVEPNPIEFTLPSRQRAANEPNNACAPTPRDPEETGTWVWGSVDGVCQWIDTTACDEEA